MRHRITYVRGIVVMASLLPSLLAAQITVSLPQNLVGTINQPIQIPMTINSLTGLNVLSYQFTVSFNPAVLSLTGVSRTGTVAATLPSPIVNTSVPGKISVASAGVLPASGSGTFIILTGTVVGVGTSSLAFEVFTLNEGTPSAGRTDGSIVVSGVNHRPVFTAVPTQTARDGDTLRVTLSAPDPDNDPVTYGFVSVTPTPLTLPVVAGNTLKWSPAFIDVGRTYGIRVSATDNITNRGGDAPGVDSMTVNVTVNRSRVRGDVDGNGLTQAADASTILRHVASVAFLTNPAALWAADVTGDGTISALDASKVLQAAAGLITIPNQ